MMPNDMTQIPARFMAQMRGLASRKKPARLGRRRYGRSGLDDERG
ncbi:hypothetical protein [Phaeovulum vinaykumarii]|nr:hypothetical protein [Phaeovulum vinaykumarii]